jgi:hypothetical protein
MRTGVSLGIAVCAALAGCRDEPRAIIPVQPLDGEPQVADAGPPRADAADAAPAAGLALTGVMPGHGPFVGGTLVTIHGAGFTASTAIRIGGKEIQVGQSKLLSPIALQVITPAGAVGPADVEARDGKASVKLAGGFRYDPVALDPDSGPTVGGTLVTILGSDTGFAAGMKLLLGGQPLTEVEIVSASVLRAKTPPGAAGPADLVFDGPGGDRVVPAAFSYYPSANPLAGGMGGGPIKGTLTVSVLNAMDRTPVGQAKVILASKTGGVQSALTSSGGSCVFAAKDLVGPVTITVGKAEFETTSMVSFDARDVTVFLLPIIKPTPGPMPPGPKAATVKGLLLFGGATGVGSSEWKIVPEPKAGQVKRAYVYATAASTESGPAAPQSTATIDFADTGATAWPYMLGTRTGALAVYAVAGLYTLADKTFEPWAMGIARGIFAGPGEAVEANVWVTIPLSELIAVQLKDLPPMGTLVQHQLRLAISLGAEGVMLRSDGQLQGQGAPPAAINFTRLPSFSHKGLLDASYSVELLLEGPTKGSSPMVGATARSVQPVAGAIVVDGFIGLPKLVAPQPGANLVQNTFTWAAVGAQPSLAVTMVITADQTPVWRILSRGDVTEVKLLDPAGAGLPPLPKGYLVWGQFLAHLPAFSFDSFTYEHLELRYWDRFGVDATLFNVP